MNMSTTVTIDEEDRQLLLLAMARFGARRPGWIPYMGDVAQKFQGRQMYDQFLDLAQRGDERLLVINDTDRLRQEIQRLMQWVQDLQSGMYINCVYCGHRYGPTDEVPATMADALKEHIAACEKHPMSTLVKACIASYHACASLLAVRDGMPDEALLRLMNFIYAALVDVVPKPPIPAPSDVDGGTYSEHDLEHVEEALAGGTNFTAELLRLIAKSDPSNRAQLRIAYPRVVEAFERWQNGPHKGLLS